MQIVLIRDTNGCHADRFNQRHKWVPRWKIWQLNHIKISKLPMLWQKKKFGLVYFFRASKFCLLSALWACDENKKPLKTVWPDCKAATKFEKID